MKLGGRLKAAVYAGGTWTTTSVPSLGPLYRNANNSRSNANVNIGGRGSIQRLGALRLNLQPRRTRAAKHANGGAAGPVGPSRAPKARSRDFNREAA